MPCSEMQMEHVQHPMPCIV